MRKVGKGNDVFIKFKVASVKDREKESAQKDQVI